MITYSAEHRAWFLGNTEFSYVFAVDPAGFHLKHLYWGRPIESDDVAALVADERDWWSNEPDTIVMRKPAAQWRGFESAPRAFTEEIVARGGFRFDEPSLSVRTADGATGLLLRYDSYEIVDGEGETTLLVRLIDEYADLRVTLGYALAERSSVLARWMTVENIGDQPVEIERAASAAWALPSDRDFRIRNFFGHVQGEFQLDDNPLPQGTRRLGSRTGTSDHRGTPWIAVHEDATEQAGEIWSVALAYSGSWQIATQRSDDRGLHVVAGVGDEEVRCILSPGNRLETPRSLGAYSAAGFSRLSTSWHDYVNHAVLPSRIDPLPVMYNSWFAYAFAVEQDSLLSQAKLAAELGAELFVIDDGWFAGRDDSHHGLGSWMPDPRAFPQGMSAFRESLALLGLELGLWVEPEMCSPDSQVYREHPDWLHGIEDRSRQTHRHQYVLDFGLPEVRDWAVQQVSQVIETSGCSYVVWDMNRPLPLGRPVGEYSPNRRHADGLTAVLDELRERHPQVTWQACSGGGGRADLGILGAMSLTWISDNTDAHDRAAMVSAASHVLPVGTITHWVTDLRSTNDRSDVLQQTTSLSTRFHTSMNGVLGISADLTRWTPEELGAAAALVAEYKQIRHLIANGCLHRLPVPRTSLAHAYVAADRSEAAVIIVADRAKYGESSLRVRLRGLDPHASYTLDEADIPQSGRLLMQHGIVLDGSQTRSWLLRIRRHR